MEGVAGLLEDDGWEVVDFVVPPVAIAGTIGGASRIATNLREDARKGASGGFREEGLDLVHVGAGTLRAKRWIDA